MANSSSTSPEITPSRTRCIVEHDTETLSLEVINYLQLKGMEVGKFVSSPVFRVGGYEWEIKFYPHGLNKDCTGTASCFVCYLGKDKDVSAKFTLSMMETKGLHAQVASFGTLDYAFTPGLHEYHCRNRCIRRRVWPSAKALKPSAYTRRQRMLRQTLVNRRRSKAVGIDDLCRRLYSGRRHSFPSAKKNRRHAT